MIRIFMIAFAGLAVTACGKPGAGNDSVGSAFDQGFRDSFRPKFVDSCVAGARQSSGTTRDFSVICGCVADKLLATKSVSELMSGPSQEDQQKLSLECIREHPLQ